MRIIITGVNGFIGKALYNHLSKYHDIIGIYNSGEPLSQNCYKADLTKEADIYTILKKIENDPVDVIIHLASQMANANYLNDLSILYVNSAISKNLALLAKSCNTKHLINFSSSSVYPNVDGIFDENSIPNPALNADCMYGLSKLNGEVILNYFLSKTQIPITHLRVAMVYGAGMDPHRLIPTLEKEILEDHSVTLYGNGERFLNLIRIEKLIEYIVLFIELPSNKVINVSEECITMLDLAKRLIQKNGNPSTKLILRAGGNGNKFILDVKKLKNILLNSKK
ncbi:NAD(P)-dependent oxidoreductase [Leptospira santarosai]|uniref:NADH(P)-binding protein, PF13460 family n=1 Tax=Leptospira santarosai str. ZUN179 TaxID=1049985 RepID=M6UXP1_9LEPT|nr:NAD(P)-dependent oxidoreductase [Leptospira santarosai]EMO45799.1 NADH(P)-binding protein, PF13460 family [Leptospira santarosai str. ZUN179]MDI7184865.1 NAD(P)-dependent oxidoreductase [Leptospira santarosai]MDI7237712.1 NAD(P)-dependent oxidoreductase [Leptospira santarosai]UZN08547.1 NAD(P)-dependent oxidoreductase [Leptospira santarosai]